MQIAKSSRREGLYILGASGTGKTGLIENLILEDIEQGLGVCLVDPHGDLTDSVLAKLPGREEDVILLDIGNEEYPFGINMFECKNPKSPKEVQKVVDQVMHIFERLFAVGRETPLILQYLRNCTHVLVANPGYTMADIPLLLTSKTCRQRLLANVKSPQVQLFWQDYDSMSLSDQRIERNNILRRVEEFLQDLTFPIVGQGKTTIDMRWIMDNRKILLVRLDTQLEQVTNLIGSMIVAQILNAAFSRADIPLSKRKQFHVYLDEYQRFATEDCATLLAEARKYGIGITIAHQFRGQLDQKNRDASLTARNFIILQVSGPDGKEMAYQFDTTPPPPTPRKLAVPQQVFDRLVSSSASHPNQEVRILVTDLLVPLLETIAVSRHLTPDERTKAKTAQTKIQFLDALFRDILEGRLVPKTKAFVERLSTAGLPGFPSASSSASFSGGIYWEGFYQRATTFKTEQDWYKLRSLQSLWSDLRWPSLIDNKSFTPFSGWKKLYELDQATPTQLLAILSLQRLSQPLNCSLYNTTFLHLALKTSHVLSVPLSVARALGIHTELVANKEQEVRDSLSRIIEDAQIREAWKQMLDKAYSKDVPDRAMCDRFYTLPCFTSLGSTSSISFTTNGASSQAFAPVALNWLARDSRFDIIESVAEEYAGCAPVNLPQNAASILCHYLKTYSKDDTVNTNRYIKDDTSEREKRYISIDKEQILAMKDKLLDLLTRYGAALFVAKEIFDHAQFYVHSLAFVYTAYYPAPELQITGGKSQMDVLRTINRLALAIAREEAQRDTEPIVDEAYVRRRWFRYPYRSDYPGRTEKEIDEAIRYWQRRRKVVNNLLVTGRIERLEDIENGLEKADTEIRTCVQPFLDTDPLAAAYLITRARMLIERGEYFANWYFPQPHLPETPPEIVTQTLAKLVALYDARIGLECYINYWTDQALGSALVDLPLTEAEHEQVCERMFGQQKADDLMKLIRLCELLAEEENRLPLLVPTDYEPTERQLTYGDTANKIANELTNLIKLFGNYTARVKVTTTEKPIECVVRLRALGQRMSQQSFEARKQRIQDHNQITEPGRILPYIRPRRIVEEEIQQRQEHCSHGPQPPQLPPQPLPDDEPPPISRWEPLS